MSGPPSEHNNASTSDLGLNIIMHRSQRDNERSIGGS